MDNTLHVHDDIKEAAEWFKIPIALWSENDVYIMQEERCVFVGTPKNANSFLMRNNGKYCKTMYPLNGHE